MPDLEAEVPGYGRIRYDVVWCGEFIANHPEHGDVTPLPFVHFMRPASAAGERGWRAGSATYVAPT